MMNITYRCATLDDIDFLLKTRIEVLLAANRLSLDVDMSRVESESRQYYLKALSEDTHVGILAYEGSDFVATGGVSFFRVMPTYHNPTGEKAYIMNMYTRPQWRRRGIAAEILRLLVAEARSRNIDAISLEATEMGRGLYARFGFVPMNSEMELPT